MRKSRPVIAFHVIMTYYGFWLPNDPRGSGSKNVWSKPLQAFGPATYVNSRQSVAKRLHDLQIRRLAKAHLKHPPVVFDGEQARCVAHGFRNHLAKRSIDCFACSVMPEHVHLVLARWEQPIEDVMIDLKGAATHELLESGRHPFQGCHDRGVKLPKLWARGGRKIFLFDAHGMRRCIDYVERNPLFDGLPKQRWSFVKPFAANPFLNGSSLSKTPCEFPDVRAAVARIALSR